MRERHFVVVFYKANISSAVTAGTGHATFLPGIFLQGATVIYHFRTDFTQAGIITTGPIFNKADRLQTETDMSSRNAGDS